MLRAPHSFFLFFLIFSHFLSGQQSATVPIGVNAVDGGLRRFEVGGGISDIRTGCIGRKTCYLPSFGLGIGAAMNLNRHFALDANWNMTPSSSSATSNVSGGHASEYLFGLRAELRARHYGYFLEAQPGVFRWDHVITQVVSPNPPQFSFVYGSVSHFVSNIGAGLEYSPTARIHVRAAMSDLVMQYGSSTWLNNLQPTAGVYAELGKSLDWKPPAYDAKKAHRFFDDPNLVLITASVLGMTADSITTQRFLSHGQMEGDPVARPFVKYGWGGQISLEALEASGEVLGMYGLHRIGHHWIERAIPVCVGAAHGVFAYGNSKAAHSTASATP
jgi:hypothetical protein